MLCWKHLHCCTVLCLCTCRHQDTDFLTKLLIDSQFLTGGDIRPDGPTQARLFSNIQVWHRNAGPAAVVVVDADHSLPLLIASSYRAYCADPPAPQTFRKRLQDLPALQCEYLAKFVVQKVCRRAACTVMVSCSCVFCAAHLPCKPTVCHAACAAHAPSALPTCLPA
jgi:hypothetical protein